MLQESYNVYMHREVSERQHDHHSGVLMGTLNTERPRLDIQSNLSKSSSEHRSLAGTVPTAGDTFLADHFAHFRLLQQELTLQSARSSIRRSIEP